MTAAIQRVGIPKENDLSKSVTGEGYIALSEGMNLQAKGPNAMKSVIIVLSHPHSEPDIVMIIHRIAIVDGLKLHWFINACGFLYISEDNFISCIIIPFKICFRSR